MWSGLPRFFCPSAHIGGQVLTSEGQTCSLGRTFTSVLPGFLATISTEAVPVGSDAVGQSQKTSGCRMISTLMTLFQIEQFRCQGHREVALTEADFSSILLNKRIYEQGNTEVASRRCIATRRAMRGRSSPQTLVAVTSAPAGGTPP
jgi:hypothetical protein